MNRGQKTVLRVYAIVIVLLCVIVPWRQYDGQGIHNAMGYRLIWSPYVGVPSDNVDIPRWCIGIIGATLAAGALVLARATPRTGGGSR